MKSIIFLTLYFLFIDQINSSKKTNWDKIIKKVNSENGSWKAGLNFPKHISSNDLKHLTGTILDYEHYPEAENKHFLKDIKDNDIPKTFEARDQWPKCKKVISHIRDQGHCGSCWAVAAASAFNDNLCIAKGITDVTISDEDVLACSFFGNCEYGGFLRVAWWHMKYTGVPSGGDYKSNEGCVPYSIPPASSFSTSIKSNKPVKTPSCMRDCTNANYLIPLKSDRHNANDFMILRGETDIQKGILKVGSVSGQFKVYEDFMTYKSGVYRYVHGNFLGGHAIRIIGWGVEKGLPYWLCANSWNKSWGENGFFKILRGSNEVEIEDVAYGGIF